MTLIQFRREAASNLRRRERHGQVQAAKAGKDRARDRCTSGLQVRTVRVQHARHAQVCGGDMEPELVDRPPEQRANRARSVAGGRFSYSLRSQRRYFFATARGLASELGWVRLAPTTACVPGFWPACGGFC